MNQSSLPLISVVTLTWNTTAITGDFLRSINDCCTYPNLEIIIVDNGSDEDPSPFLKSIREDISIILNGRNLGFTGGNNIGIQAAKGDYLFIVNNDTEFTPGLLEGMLEIFSNYPDAGMVSPKFHYFFHKGTIEYAGYHPENPFTGRNSMIGCREKDTGQYEQIRETHYAHGGGMMVPKSIIQKVGMLPDEFFIYYEELDWSEQIKRAGYKIYYQPKSLSYHKESMTTGKESPFKAFYHTRNRILFMLRNMSFFQRSIFLVYFSLFTVPKNSLKFMVNRQFKHLKSFWKGIFWHFNKQITFNR